MGSEGVVGSVVGIISRKQKGFGVLGLKTVLKWGEKYVEMEDYFVPLTFENGM